ncbi:cytochrome P450 family protein [Pseudonocardia acidicola]|uniref:Cytochrome P450 n=1 Tax=Pseudonocardia acidicola TaxID=2724939 RepID=A0ABX1SE70_9PSEU|nr:cytochrome P450 [Pseudonocardia acidicola]NMH99405.1 cytochrome P450 [Pseudonocardia acidicola]
MTETAPAATAGPEVFDGAFWADPHPAYARLRTEQPVCRLELPDGPVWLITRYDDVRAAFTDPRLSKDWRYTLPPEARAGAPASPTPMMLLMDPPDHTRLRKLVSRSFTARRMAELRPRISEIAAGLLDALPAAGKVDLMADYASELPVQVICELLGVPAADRDDFSAWSRVMIDESPAEDKIAASAKLAEYLSALIDRTRAEPDQALLSALVQVSDEDGDRLSQEELVGMAMLLLIAGHETTVNLIGNGVLGLLTHPDQLARLRERPELMPGAVEEFLRWDSPVSNAPVRFAAEDVEIAGVTIPQGSVVMLGLAAANRDGARFPDADRLDVERDAGGHVAFGHGLHFCLGAQLARIEGEVAIGALLARFPDLSLAVDPAELVYRRSTLVRGLMSLLARARK